MNLGVQKHVSQAIRVRFSTDELQEIKTGVIEAACNKYLFLADDKYAMRWFTNLVDHWVEALDKADQAFALPTEKTREILSKIQRVYSNAYFDGGTADSARRAAIFSAVVELSALVALNN